MPQIFCIGEKKQAQKEEELTAPLYEEIERLKMDVKWLEKSSEPAADHSPELGGVRPRLLDTAAVQAGRHPARKLLLRAGSRVGRKPVFDATD